MFDSGFSELVLVGVVALLVFGPERLPRVAREAALWIRKGRSMVSSVKSEINRELQLEELRQSLQQEKQQLESKALDHLTLDALAAFPSSPAAASSAAAPVSAEEPRRHSSPSP